jgi:hypothetical protein
MTTITNPHIQKRIEERLAKARAQHSIYWLGDEAEELLTQCEPGSPEHLRRLRVIQRAIGNFVQIVTGHNIPVTFSSGKMSYTDGKQVVISADLDPSKIDVQVGLALHEASHCLLSNESLAFLPKMEKNFRDLVKNSTIVADGAKIGMTEDQVRQLIQMMMNYLEDRRIDLWMYENASGYRPYYQALYDAHWHNPKIDNALRDPKFRDPSVRNYELFVINMTNKHFDVTALPGLDEIRDIVNFTRKGLFARGDEDTNWRRWTGMGSVNHTHLPLLFADALKMAEIVVRNSKSVKSENQQSQNGQNGQPNDMKGQSGKQVDTGMPNMDFSPTNESGAGETEYRPVSGKELDEALEQLRRFLDHKGLEEQKEALPQKIQQDLKSLEDAKADFKTVEGDFLGRNVKCPIIIYREVTKQTVQKDSFPMRFGAYGYGRNGGRNPDAERAVADGIRMGQILASRISVVQDDKPLKFTRQETGRIDKRLIAGLGYGNESVFHHIVTEQRQPVDVWLDIDLSGSMAGDKFRNAMTLAVAIAYAAEKNRKMNCTIAVRDGGSSHAHLAIIYDSKRHKFQRVRDVVPYLSAAGGTPEALCFEAVKEEILKTSKGAKKYFINLSDGEPGHGFKWKGRHYSYGGESAYTHTRRMMQEFRASGITVMSYYIGHTKQEHAGFRKMYGQDAHFIDPASVTGIARTLNKIMVGGGQ